MKKTKKILFILKRNQVYAFNESFIFHKNAGLYNSTRLVAEAIGNSHVIEVHDNNCIDREVTKYKPDIVVIEALWVVPEKFDILKKLHPKVKWYVHLHSHTPFMALEGISMEWNHGYVQRGVKLIINFKETYKALVYQHGEKNVVYLPNVYIQRNRDKKKYSQCDQINIGCFGAIRPLKNHLAQAIAAIQFAKEIGKTLYFHINHTRVENMGAPVLKNLKALFDTTPNAYLVEHNWLDHNQFLDLVGRMDIGMQVSFTETFNIVTADAVTCGIPVVVSKEIDWVSRLNYADVNSIEEMTYMLHVVYCNKYIRKALVFYNRLLLKLYAFKARYLWRRYFRKHHC